MEYAEFKVRVRILPPAKGWEDGPEGIPIRGLRDERPPAPAEWGWADLMEALLYGHAEEPVIIDYWGERT